MSVLGSIPQLQATSLAPIGTGGNTAQRCTRLLSAAMAQVEPMHFEKARSGRRFAGGITLIANAIVPVVALPTTLAPVLLYNAATPGPNARSLVIDLVAAALASGTEGAAGFSIFGGVTPAPIASASVLTANGTGYLIAATRGTGLSAAFMASAGTIPAGTPFVILDGLVTLAASVTGAGKGVWCNGSFVVPPGFGFAFGVYGDLGTAAKYMMSCIWDELEGDTSP